MSGNDTNHLGQPIGRTIPGWTVPQRPARLTLGGRFCRLEPLDPERHASSLFAANALDREGRSWTYLPYGPFETVESYLQWMKQFCLGEDPFFYAIVDAHRQQAVGLAAYLRVDPPNGSIEVGHLVYSPLLQRTPAATESMFLMMKHAFELGYRRYEWKCHSLNAPSRAAAERLGFTFEGIFRQAAVLRGCNRDTAWYSILDQEWPALKAAFERWLDPSNFDPQGKQRARLSALSRTALSTVSQKISGIGGIFFRARDPESLAAWYRDHLGIQSEGGYTDFLWREHDRPGAVGRTVWSLFPDDTDYFGPSRPAFMINYRVANLDPLLAELREKGTTIEKIEEHDYGRFAWITDPEGNRIELWQPKEV